MPIPVVLIFDVGKTNKKIFLFDAQYKLVYEEATELEETKDEDGFPCEDVNLLTTWIQQTFQKIQRDKRYQIIAINVSAYGASFVHLGFDNKPYLPLYNYLKPYEEALQKQFYTQYGSEEKIAEETASPVLGNLNSGMQLYWLKHRKPEQYAMIRHSLHLPQYISFILCGSLYSDVTSIGCHTGLWDFHRHTYHYWVYNEEIDKKLVPVVSSHQAVKSLKDNILIGCGLHDSSAALIPYLASFPEPFVLISTGTWNISLNPFNQSPLTAEELQHDCLSYLSYEGNPVKAARLFAGYEHEQQVKRFAAHFNTSTDHYKTVSFDDSICRELHRIQPAKSTKTIGSGIVKQSLFQERNLHIFKTYEEAYHQLMLDIIKLQIESTKLIMTHQQAGKLFVDGGFSKNDIYMNLLATAFPNAEVYSAVVAQASALGAAIAIRKNDYDTGLLPGLIALKRYLPANDLIL